VDSLDEDASLFDQGTEPTDTNFEPMSTSGLSAADLAAVTRLWSTSRDGAS
jgi:mycobactin peptide synthetase MbtE